MKTIALLLGLTLATPLAFGQTMYKWVDKDGKTHYTDSPPPEDAKKLAAPKSNGPGAVAQRSDGRPGRSQGSFRPEEEAALAMVCAISLTESLTCQLKLRRACSLDELVMGVEGQKLARDPRSDPNYNYRLDTKGDDVVVHAVPASAGLTGFFSARDIHYNVDGAAGKGDPKIVGGVSCLKAMAW